MNVLSRVHIELLAEFTNSLIHSWYAEASPTRQYGSVIRLGQHKQTRRRAATFDRFLINASSHDDEYAAVGKALDIKLHVCTCVCRVGFVSTIIVGGVSVVEMPQCNRKVLISVHHWLLSLGADVRHFIVWTGGVFGGGETLGHAAPASQQNATKSDCRSTIHVWWVLIALSVAKTQPTRRLLFFILLHA